MKHYPLTKRIVIKVGTSVLAPQGKIDSRLVSNIVKEIVDLDRKNVKSVLVSSGAIVSGMSLLGYKKKPSDIKLLQAYASLGQVVLMNVYAYRFKRHRKLCAQVLLTWDDFNDRVRYLNARHTIERLLNLGIVPIINENDAVSTEEIKFGDNDTLSALVSDLIRAELLLILSDVEGLFCGKEVVKTVENIDDQIMKLVKKRISPLTAGGMGSKLKAAKIATQAGIRVIIANGRTPKVISKAVKGESIGTLFLPKREIERAKRRWIAFGKKIKGKLYVDEGAKEAILYRGKSLLSCGIVKVEGEFSKKDAVEVLDSQGKVLGCGLVEYNSTELMQAKGKRLDREVIHRDNFVKRGVNW
ncbi:MAG: glutamate 5-kinase [Candidatus Omnitrophota bacterium]|nr:MAG: glutamate 5-kinase [Candidatus Omnitrophota bacterium]HDN86132.1 glutamate 5-kinase [Candidatus Omnitrophota bacterium]